MGKSVVTLGLGDALARLGQSVTLVDLDLGASNMHTLLGHKKMLCGVGAFVRGEQIDLDELALNTDVGGLWFVPGAGLIPGVANAKYREKRRIFSGLKKLKSDYVLLDLGGGTSANTLDFFTWANRGIIVTAPTPSAILNAYEFLKNAVYRRLLKVLRSEPHVRSIVEHIKDPGNAPSINTIRQLADCVKDINRQSAKMILSAPEGMPLSLILNFADGNNGTQLVEKLCSIAKRFLSVNIRRIGEIPYDWQIEQLIRRLRPLTALTEGSLFRQSMTEIAVKLLETDHSRPGPGIPNRIPEKEPISVDRGFESKVIQSHMKSIKILAQLLNSYLLNEGPANEDPDSEDEVDNTESVESAISENSTQKTYRQD